MVRINVKKENTKLVDMDKEREFSPIAMENGECLFEVDMEPTTYKVFKVK